MRAIIRQVRITPKKANLVAGIVRNTKAETSIAKLKFMPKKAARILYKLISSAVANAENNFGQKKEDLLISKIIVNEGPVYKRGQSHAKGRVTSLYKRTSHITVELEAGEVAKIAKKKSGKLKKDSNEDKADEIKVKEENKETNIKKKSNKDRK